MREFVKLCLQQRWVVVGLAVLFVALAGRGVRDARFDAFPEFAPPRVEIQTEAPGLSSEEVEALVTTPLEAALAGTPGMTAIRSRSVLGLSSVVLLFPTGTDLLQARALVQERVTRAAPGLPTVARTPVLLSPLSSTSRIMKIGMWSATLSQTELSDLARWRVRPALMSVPGVANVAVWGERRRRIEVRADPDRLVANGVDLSRLVAATRESLTPRAGGLVDLPTTRLPVVQTAMARDAEELSRVPLSTLGRGTVTIGDVAEVRESHSVPIGDALVTSGSGVLLIVEKQPGASTLDVTAGIDAALGRLRPGLSGVEVDPTIFRPASFIERALRNLGHAMGIGCAFVVAVLFLFLWNTRTALISVLAIPLSLLAAAFVLTLLGRTIDTMVIAGLVIALGEVVDDAIIDVENIHRRLRALPEPPDLRTAMRVVLDASLEVRSAIVFASLIVLLVFVPILFLEGVAGEFFRPLALAYGLAILASTVTALTITPVLALLLLRRTQGAERHSPIATALLRAYEPVLRRTLNHPKRLLAGTLGLLAMTAVLGSTLREEFLPHFAENDFLMHWVARPGTSLEAVARTANLARAELLTVPGVRNFGAHIGRAEVADEVVGPNFAELWISVDPNADLAVTSQRVRDVVDGYPGVFRDVQTYLQERMREVLSGGGGAIVIRLRGDDIDALRAIAGTLAHDLEAVPGISHARPEAQVLVPQIQIHVDADRCAAFGIEPGLVRARAATLLAGDTAGQFVRGLQPIDVVVWGTEASRADVASVRDLGIAVDGRVLTRLGDVADVTIVPVPNTIAHDATTRKLDVLIDLAPGADLSSVSTAVASRVSALELPPGHHAEILGEGAARSAARTRLFGVAALAIVGIFFVLLADFRSARLALMVFAGLPFALVGGVVAAATSGVVSLGTLIGLVAVIGIAARNGIMLVSHFRHLEGEEGVPFGRELVVRGARERLGPILMTALATGLALVPVVIGGHTAGHEIEHPMAVVILGGLVSSTILTLLVTPALYVWLGGGGRGAETATVD
ncbi:MAG: efflux RND transporter permease subunit [Kofleriaceae bacterium]|nr:efflux RND transporter permease subunit [Kofleriaceae bacterium]MBP9166952.1 efflux RND transporter permease subunit [Kofleriaceae bacterium]MBP9862440.1 efflux RND transporter permease subunit [Kofleriaceae bacterium]